jgi:hypothetical protein
MLSNLVDYYQCFGGVFHLHLSMEVLLMHASKTLLTTLKSMQFYKPEDHS